MSAGAWGDLYSHTLLEGMHNYPDTLENSHTPTIWPMSSTAASYSLKEKKQCPYIAIHDIQLCVCAQSLSRVQLFGTPWAAARQAPLSMGFSRQEYWSGLPCPPPGDLPNPGIEPRSSRIAGGSPTFSEIVSEIVPNLETIQMSINGWRDHQTVEYLHSGRLEGNK